MKKSARKALVDDAGRLYLMRQELAALQNQRDQLEQRIRQLERKLTDAEQQFDSTWERVVTVGRGDNGAGSAADEPLTPGKLPHRILVLMQRDDSRLYTAADLAADLRIRDVQQVRTALARLVGKRLVRRAGVKGQFTI